MGSVCPSSGILRGLVTIGLAALAAVSIFALCSADAATGKPVDGEPLTDTQAARSVLERRFRRLDGPDTSLSALSGDITILHFWASWCAPCRDELPALQGFHDAHRAALIKDGIRFVTISNDFRADEAQRMLEKSGLSLPVLMDPRQTVNLALTGQRTLPFTLAVHPDGSIHILARGPLDWSSPDMLESLRASVAGQKF